MRTKVFVTLAVALVVAMMFAPSWAQAQGRGPEELKILAQVGLQIGENMKALTGYSFQQRTAVNQDDEQKNVTLVQVAFGPGGQPLITTLSSQPPEDLGRGPLRRKIKEEKIEEFKDMVEQVVQLSNSYLMLNQEKLSQLGQLAQVWVTPGGGQIRIVASGFQQPGDQVTISCDGQTKRQTQTQVTTSIFGGPMTVVAQYQQWSTGLNYNIQTVINVPQKQLQITINTMNYMKQ
jgi:hypothetical protein